MTDGVGKPTGDMLRPLGDLEYTYWFMDIASRTNFAVMADIEGAMEEPELARALEAVRPRYPLLNVRVTKNESRRTVFAHCSKPIPIRSEDADRCPVEGLLCEGPPIENLDRERSIRMDTETGPLVRCLLLRHAGNRRTLMLTFQHAIADARSAMHVLHDVLSAMDGKPLSGPADRPSPDESPPLEHYIPTRHAGPVAVLRAAAHSTAQGVQRIFTRPVTVPAKPRWPDQRLDCFLMGRFRREETMKLTTASRKEGCGIHAALCAAQLMALLAEYPGRKAIRSWLLTLVDLRNRGTRPVSPEQLGLMISMVEHCQKVKQGASLWELAREIRQRIAERLEQGFHFCYLPVQARMIHNLDRMVKANDANSRKLLRIGHLSRPMAMPVSNIGRVELPSVFTTFTVRDMTFIVPLSSSGIWGSATNTFNNRLNWNFSYASPSIPKEQAARMARRSMDIVRTHLS